MNEFRRDTQIQPSPGTIIAEFANGQDVLDFKRLKGPGYYISPGINQVYALRVGPTPVEMAMLPNDHHPGSQCLCQECLLRWATGFATATDAADSAAGAPHSLESPARFETEFDRYAPPESAWMATDADTYDGSASEVGRGKSPDEAIADLKEKLESV